MFNRRAASWLNTHMDEMSLFAAVAVAIALVSVLKPDLLKSLVLGITTGIRVRAWRWLRKWRKTGGDGIWIGHVFLSDEARRRHTHIVGATGSGKTVLLEHLIYQDLERGHGALIIDPKGDRDFYERLRAFCARIGRADDLHLFSATHAAESVRWNPCSLGTASELQSKWFNSGTYSEPFYAKACELALLQAFNGLVEDMDSFGVADLVERMERLADKKKSEHIEGLFLELKNFAEGEWGELLCVPGKKSRAADPRKIASLRTITRKSEILFVDLPTEARAIQSSRVGKLMLMEMMLLSGIRKAASHERGTRPFSIFVDEFDAFATEQFATFLNKGRSSDFMIHIAHQSLGDLEKVGPAFQKIIMNNCNVRCVFQMHDPDDADYLSRFAGTRTAVKKTFRTENGLLTGQSSNRETEEFLVHPNQIKRLRIGECLFSVKSERFLEVVRLPMPKFKPTRSVATERATPASAVTSGGDRLDRGVDEYAGLLVAEAPVRSKGLKGGK